MAVRPSKTQISLGIRPVRSESSLSAWRKTGFLAIHWAYSKDSDQTGRMPRLIWVFAGRTVILLVFLMSWLVCSRMLVACRTHNFSPICGISPVCRTIWPSLWDWPIFWDSRTWIFFSDIGFRVLCTKVIGGLLFYLSFFCFFRYCIAPSRGLGAGGLHLIVIIQSIRKRTQKDDSVKRTYIKSLKAG